MQPPQHDDAGGRAERTQRVGLVQRRNARPQFVHVRRQMRLHVHRQGKGCAQGVAQTAHVDRRDRRSHAARAVPLRTGLVPHRRPLAFVQVQTQIRLKIWRNFDFPLFCAMNYNDYRQRRIYLPRKTQELSKIVFLKVIFYFY
jgi:hypothetical protein